jgi:imidazolonepropionase-like amidohydrolase
LVTIEPSRLAGIVVVDGNLPEEITILRHKNKIILVMKAG